jgi:hypothetical protein
LGSNHDVLHTLEALEGPLYGCVQAYVVRPQSGN